MFICLDENTAETQFNHSKLRNLIRSEKWSKKGSFSIQLTIKTGATFWPPVQLKKGKQNKPQPISQCPKHTYCGTVQY